VRVELLSIELPVVGHGELFGLDEYREKYLMDVHPDLVGQILAFHLREGYVVVADLTGEKPMFRLGPAYYRSKSEWN
jgi:hypothetical protein